VHVLELSYMYPSPRHPTAGVFVEDQVRALARDVSVDVVSPVPWAPRVLWPLSPRWRAYGRQPRRQQRAGIAVHHPRYLQPVGQWSIPFAGVSMALAARARVRALNAAHAVDVLHVHQLVPDGLAGVLLGRWLRCPVVCTLHGSDVTEVPFHDPMATAAARRVARDAAAFVAVAPFLVEHLTRLGPVRGVVHVVSNGVDTERFRPVDRHEARRALDLPDDGPLILQAGLLIPRKGVDVLIHAFARLLARKPAARLLLVGGSDERDDQRPDLERLADGLGCRDRVRFVGRRPHDELPLWFSAADVVALASRLEGFPTVVREAIACGTPCVTTALPGLADEIGPASGVECGLVVPPDDSPALATALAAAVERRWDRTALVRRAERWSWKRNAAAMVRIFADATRSRPRAAA
jgi:glycosyltransferase involved in cell wall biosynthesis